MEGFVPFVPGGIAYHHIAAGTLGILAGLFHLSVCPPQLYTKDYVWSASTFLLFEYDIFFGLKTKTKIQVISTLKAKKILKKQTYQVFLVNNLGMQHQDYKMNEVSIV